MGTTLPIRITIVSAAIAGQFEAGLSLRESARFQRDLLLRSMFHLGDEGHEGVGAIHVARIRGFDGAGVRAGMLKSLQ